jgi:hypothetical protein
MWLENYKRKRRLSYGLTDMTTENSPYLCHPHIQGNNQQITKIFYINTKL